MRKLKLQVQMSVDGYIAGPNGEMDWMVWNWDDTLKKYVDDLTDSIDCILLGRKMAPGFIAHWAKVAADPEYYAFLKESMALRDSFIPAAQAKKFLAGELAVMRSFAGQLKQK